MHLDARTEAQIRLLSERRNRAILDVLNEADDALGVEELVDRLVSRDVTVVSETAYDERVDRTTLRLHHERLPKLAEAGLVEYDRDASLVCARPSPAHEVDWQDEAKLDELLAYLASGHDDCDGEIGVLEGRASIVEYECQLADEADEELFTMYASTDLIEEKCVRHATSAQDRGVTLFVGSHDEAVREIARTHVPDAIVWEPQLDWLNTTTCPRVGRLVLVDRRTVVVAILDEPPSEGAPPEETALVGTGENNPLVVLVRELLGPRLDHLDYQSDEFRSNFPTHND